MRYFKNRFFIICFTVVLCLTVFSVVLSASGNAWFLKDAINVISTPIRVAFNYCADGIEGFFDYFTEFDRIVAENEQLRAENEELNKLKTDIEVLKDQLMGVDSAYMGMLIDALAEQKEKDENFEIDSEYVIELVNRIF